MEIVEQETSFLEPVDTIISSKWIPEQEVSQSLKNYFRTICLYVVSTQIDKRKMALNNLSENTRIGPIVGWFYRFSYLIMSTHFTCDYLFTCAVNIILALQKNFIANITVTEKQVSFFYTVL